MFAGARFAAAWDGQVDVFPPTQRLDLRLAAWPHRPGTTRRTTPRFQLRCREESRVLLEVPRDALGLLRRRRRARSQADSAAGLAQDWHVYWSSQSRDYSRRRRPRPLEFGRNGARSPIKWHLLTCRSPSAKSSRSIVASGPGPIPSWRVLGGHIPLFRYLENERSRSKLP